MATSTHARGHATDFATRSIFDGSTPSAASFDCSSGENAGDEIHATLTELIQSFGASHVRECLTAIPSLSSQQSASGDAINQAVQQALRGFALIIIEAKHKGAVALIVAKLAKMELVSGAPIHLEDIGRQIGVSKQAVSRMMAGYAERLGLPRPYSSPSARQSHRLMNKRNYQGHEVTGA